MNRYFYTKEHEWVSIDNGIATLGITDYAQKQLGDIVFVEFPSKGTQYEQGSEIAVIESVKAASEIYAPISGKVCECNQEVEHQPGIVNSNSEDEGWLIKLSNIVTNEMDSLMNEIEYKSYINEIEG